MDFDQALRAYDEHDDALRLGRVEPDAGSGELARPVHTATFVDRARDRVAAFPWRETRWWTAVAVLGLVIAGGGAVVGWQRWAERSDVPIDDVLPMLVVDPSATDPAATADTARPESGASVSPGGGVDEAPSASEPVQDELAREANPAAVAASQVAGDGPSSEGGDPAVSATVAPTLYVHVSGAVARPGVVRVGDTARVFEAVDAAGGLTGEADTERINLAAPLVDGERIHVPAIGEDEPPQLVATQRPAAPTSLGAGAGAGSGSLPSAQVPLLIDINAASAIELEALPGVGPATAAAIIDLRQRRGPYGSVDELDLVPGIGPSKLETMRPYVTVG